MAVYFLTYGVVLDNLLENDEERNGLGRESSHLSEVQVEIADGSLEDGGIVRHDAEIHRIFLLKVSLSKDQEYL